MKFPVPLASVVLESAIVGFALILQQTPAVTVAPPSLVTLPPEVAVVPAILLIAAVVTVGNVAGAKLRIAIIPLIKERSLVVGTRFKFI